MAFAVVLETLRPFVEAGTIRWLGLCEPSIDVMRRAKAVPDVGEKIVAVQMEFSPLELGAEKKGMIEAAKELGMTVVASSPMGRGGFTSANSHHFLRLTAGSVERLADRKIPLSTTLRGRGLPPNSTSLYRRKPSDKPTHR